MTITVCQRSYCVILYPFATDYGSR